MNEYIFIKSKEYNQILEVINNDIVYWSLKPEYNDLCENCMLYGIDEFYGEEAYQQVKDTCPRCINGSNFEYLPDIAPLNKNEIEQYLNTGDFNSFSRYFKINIEDIINTPSLFIDDLTDDSDLNVYYIGKYPSIIEARNQIMLNIDL